MNLQPSSGATLDVPALGKRHPGRAGEPLFCWESMAQYVGDDHETQLQVVQLCIHALADRMPQLERAISSVDRKTVGRIAHDLRGSLGMLGLPELVSLSEKIEYDNLSNQRWLESCHDFLVLLMRVNEDLQQLPAA